MGKKITFAVVFVLLVAVLAFAGLYFFAPDDVDYNPTTPDFTEIEETVTSTDNDEYMDDVSDETVLEGESFEVKPTEKDKVDDYVPSDEHLTDNGEDVIYSEFSISKIVDHTTGEEVSPRVVFGYGYKDGESYLKFDSKGTFELYFSGYFNTTTKGTFSEHDNIIYVEYDDGSAAEYDIKYNDSGIISYVKVNHGDYDIYFS